MKFKVGDKVRIRKDATAEEWYGSEIFVPYMEKHKGKILTIVKVNPNNKKYKCDNCEDWVFTDEMLEPVNETVVDDKEATDGAIPHYCSNCGQKINPYWSGEDD